MRYYGIAFILSMFLVGCVAAAPTVGVASDVTNNGFNSTLSGCSGDCWIEWGQYSGKEIWKSQSISGDGEIQVQGAPIFGGENIYFHACDSSGCGNEESTTILAVTPLPEFTVGRSMDNITSHRFDPMVISAEMVNANTQTTGVSIFYTIICAGLLIGMWLGTGSTRLVSLTGILVSSGVLVPSVLGIQIPTMMQMIAQGLLIASLAGMALSYMRRGG